MLSLAEVMSTGEEAAKKYFDPAVTDRERAVFEGGIALAAIYHQFAGVPIPSNPKSIEALERTIADSAMVRPYKKNVTVKIDRVSIKTAGKHPYDYETLKGKHLDVSVETVYGRARAVVRMKYVPEIDYNLMFIEKVEQT